MKPAPFDDVDYKDPKTHLHLVSKQSSGKKSEFTEVIDKKKKSIWKMKEFIGRYQFELSVDGHILITYGDFYFGSQLNISSDADLATVYRDGKVTKKIKFSDVYKKTGEELATELKLSVKGGGWIDRKVLIHDLKIDWEKHQIEIQLYDNTLKNFSF